MSNKHPFALMCPVCLDDYDTGECAPLVGTCGHSVCVGCIAQIGTSCPTCMNSDAFSARVKNFPLIEVIVGLADILKKMCPDPDKQCTKCKREITDDKTAYTCISCSTCAEGASADDFLTKAGRNRFCGSCELPKEPHVPRRWRDVKMAVKSKQIAEKEKFSYYKTSVSELDRALSEAKASISTIEEQFPFGKKISGDCSDRKWERLQTTTKASLVVAGDFIKQGIDGLNTMTDKLNKISNTLGRMQYVVALDPQDNDFLDKINFSDNKSPAPITPNISVRKERRVSVNYFAPPANGSCSGSAPFPSRGFDCPPVYFGNPNFGPRRGSAPRRGFARRGLNIPPHSL